MKSFLACVILILSGSLCAAGEPEPFFKMDMTKTKGTALASWINNKAINPKDEVLYIRQENDAPFLRGKNKIHYYWPKRLWVNSADILEIRITARGEGIINPTYYRFSKDDKEYCYLSSNDQKLTREWKTFKTLRAVDVYEDKPSKKQPEKAVRIVYLDMVRPLIELRAKHCDFKDYEMRIIRNQALKGWRVDHAKSNGMLKTKLDGSEVALSKNMEFRYQDLINVKAGETLRFTIRAKGKGKIIVGYLAYRIPPKRGRYSKLPDKTILREYPIDSADWKEMNIPFVLDNMLDKKGQKIYIEKVRPLFRIQAKQGSTMDIKQSSFKFIKEELTMPDF